MRARSRAALGAALFLVSLTPAAPAQQPGGLVADLLVDIGQVEEKLLGLARAMPDAAFNYKPGEGVRTSAQVLQHVAADNYFMPTAWKRPAPAATAITSDYNTVMAYETRKASRDEVIADLTRSFTHLKEAMQAVEPGWLQLSQDFFGSKLTGQAVLVLTTTHLHEHLGQLIAYARANGIKPPWSN